ncbi:MAG: SDR family NAD(P)-dependent oxidoreductase [Desulfobacterales bacterium]|nr:SDR family NAD(P)-dependent oxidoreductase [Desulfobacterales bacterium]
MTDHTDYRSLLEKAFLEMKKMRSKLEAADKAKKEPVAIIGMGCRFPGDVVDSESYWRLLRAGTDAVTDIPSERWPVDNYFDTNPDVPGKMYIRSGGYLKGIDMFDPQFFSITPREAMNMDPQQRILLEVTWEALENAGYIPENLGGSNTGIFMGASYDDYSQLSFYDADPYSRDAYSFMSTIRSIATGRLAYFLNFQGPVMQFDTACSSSLMAIHQACQSLRTGECGMALAGGANIIISPEVLIGFCHMNVLARDGRCKTFSAAADGYGRGEGCGVVVLKRLSDALADNDNILALIRSSATNHDGRSNGLTAPNGVAQESLIHEALKKAGLKPEQIQYVEAHGTGTALGDPIEVLALGAVLGQNRSKDDPLLIGSVKSNFGHQEVAAGVAAFMKTVLSLQHAEIPPHLHFNEPNPYIPWDKLSIKVPTEPTPWPSKNGPRLAGVSAFGMSGTNVHVIMESAEDLKLETGNWKLETGNSQPGTSSRPVQILCLSAKTEKALFELADRYVTFLESHSDVSLPDVCFSANTGRSHFDCRLAVIAESADQLAENLSDFAKKRENTGSVNGQVRSKKQNRIAFLFTGQGSQYVGMGQQLFETQPVFRRTLEQCDEILRPYLERPLLQVMYPDDGDGSWLLDETAYTQPALFALEYALAQLWISWGIEPAAVMGHSVGEYVAACVAGVFSLEDGLKLIAERGRLMQSLPREGEMVAVAANETIVEQAVQPYASEISIAAFNGPDNIVISGNSQAVSEVTANLTAQGVKTTKLNVSHAFHSHLMEPMLDDFKQAAVKTAFSPPKINLISNLTGESATSEIATPAYWCRHVRSPVKFADSIKSLLRQDYEVFLETGPKPVLTGMARRIPDSDILNSDEESKIKNQKSKILYLPSMRPNMSDWHQMLLSLGELYVYGAPADWQNFDRDYSCKRIPLPTYPWQRQRYWVSSDTEYLWSVRKDKLRTDHHPLIATGQRCWSETDEEELRKITVAQKSTQISDLLNSGDTEQLTQVLAKAGKLSEDRMKSVPEILEVLIAQHHKQLKLADVKKWLYQTEWHQQPELSPEILSDKSFFSEPGSWIIFADRTGVGQILAEYLENQGQTCHTVYAGNSYNTEEKGTVIIDPARPDHFTHLFGDILEKNDLPLNKIIHLWSLDTTTDNLTISDIDHAQNIGCISTLHLLQAIMQNESLSPRLWLVTRGGAPVSSNVPNSGSHVSGIAVAQSPLWGLAKVIDLEHPEIWGGITDLDPFVPSDSSEQAFALISEIRAHREDNIAFRNGNRYSARLVQMKDPTSHFSLLTSHFSHFSRFSYLITGGLGKLGLRVARWMAENGAGHLILTGRSGASSKEAQETVKQLELSGVQIVVAKTDVSDKSSLTELFENIKASVPPLRGLIHAAGVLNDRMLLNQNQENFCMTIAPKVKGAWNLHVLTKDMPLDFFVCFSSMSSVLGAEGQGSYAAANFFLDALAHYRRQAGLPAVSINWGPWAGGGMVTEESGNWLALRGMHPLQPEHAIEALEYLIGTDCTQAAATNTDWTVFKGICEVAQRRLLEQIEIQPVDETPQSEIIQKLEHAPANDRPDILTSHIQNEVAEILWLDSSDIPELNKGFFDMGIDSLLALELKKRLEKALGQILPTTLAFEHPTIETLADFLLREVLSFDLAEKTVTNNHKDSDDSDIMAAKLEELSETEAEELLMKKLAML